jgi:hypothetical protein
VGVGATVRGWVREWQELFRPRDERFVELLLRQAHLAAEAGAALLDYLVDPSAAKAERVSELEAEGDRVLEEIMVGLRQSLVAPIAGSDVYYLGNAMDDVLDQVEDMVQEDQAVLELHPDDPPYREAHFLEATRAFADAVAELPAAVEALFRRPREADSHLVRLRALYGDGKRSYQLAFAALLGQAEGDAGRAFRLATKVQWVRLHLRRVEKITNALAGILATS